MRNMSTVTYFIFTGYTEMEKLRYLYFCIFLILYICIVGSNFVIIGIIYAAKSLHEPMYIYICTLMCNGLYGSTSLFPSLLKYLLSSSYEISIACCLTQVYCLHTFCIAEFTILAVMGYDRYVAICHPLHYHSIMSPRRLYALIAFSWIFPFIAFALYFMLTVRLTYCNNLIYKVYCINFSVVKLSCNDISVNNIVGLALIAVFILPQVIVIVFSYIQILIVCVHSGRKSQLKALQTCGPHIFAVANYFFGWFFEIIQSRFNMSHVPYGAFMFMSLYFLIFPPLLNPIIYGISTQAIRVKIINIFKMNSKLYPGLTQEKM